jgi:hypothetical protein
VRHTVRVSRRDDWVDPWGGVVAGVAGGLAWAVAAPAGALALPLGIGVAAVVYGVKVGASLLGRRMGGREQLPEADAAQLPPPRRGSPAATWLSRADAAVRSLHELVRSPTSAGTREQLAPVAAESAGVLSTMRQFGGQVTAVDDALARVPSGRLEADRERLVRAVEVARTESLRAERRRALDSVEQQLAVASRLSDARDTLLARMQSTALGLEGLVARTAELVALAVSSGSDNPDDRIAELTGDLEGLRAGLAEAEAISKRVLDG